MAYRRLSLFAVVCALSGFLAAQQKGEAPEQSPRKAILEMFSGGEEAVKKHLTLEVQEKIRELLKSSAPGNADPIQAMTMARAAGGQNLESFDTGPILFSYNNAQQHGRFEVRIDSDDLRGDRDEMQLSLHAFRNGIEEDLPIAFQLLLSWKLQQSIWRLNTVTVSATVPVGDPRILDKSLWQGVSSIAGGEGSQAATQPSAAVRMVGGMNDQPKMTAARAVRLIGLAENIYAQKHPATGFTCAISELVDVGKGLDNGEPYKFMDPEFAQGIYNGYRFSLTGCTGNPAKNFRVVAEPLTGTGRAYCSDNTRDLRGSDDGSGANCLLSGKIVQR
jgi:hypothetical protein